MRVVMRHETVLFDGNIQSINDIKIKLSEILERTQLFVSSIVVDGLEFDGELDDYIAANGTIINEIQIILISQFQLILEMMSEGERYISRAIPEIERLSDELYKGASGTTWNKFNQLIEGIQWILQLTHTLDQAKEALGSLYHDDMSLVHHTLSTQLGNLEESLQNDDQVLTGDYLLYEILPEFEKLYSLLLNSLSMGVAANEPN